MQQAQVGAPAVVSAAASSRSGGSDMEAPPKQVALAMDRLGHAARLIADIRLGADRLLEALYVVSQPNQSTKSLQLFLKEDASMRQHLQDLRSIGPGRFRDFWYLVPLELSAQAFWRVDPSYVVALLGRQLDDSGVLNESLRLRSNSWGLHMPLVCPDGAVVAYAWKRQLAGQAGASAVDRTRLALKAFTDQKRRFFPHLDHGIEDQSSGPFSKKQCAPNELPSQEELGDCKTLLDILTRVDKEVPNLKLFAYERLDWLKQASKLPSLTVDSSVETLKEHDFHGSDKIKPGSLNAVVEDKVAVIELLFPSVFRAIVSLHPVGSVEPDAVAFFSPDEGGSYMHARGVSVHHVFRHITEHAALALQYFLEVQIETALYTFLLWICNYETLFRKVCSKCGKLLSLDNQSALPLPPVIRSYRQFHASKISSTLPRPSARDLNLDPAKAFHIGCYSEEL